MQRLEIGRWHRGGYLRAGTTFTWSWNRGGEATGSVGVQVFGTDSLRLQYSIVGNGDQRGDASQTIRIAHTACHFGGARPWFQCPVCQNRAAVLYMRFSRFACRKCQRVSYSTQSGSSHDRVCKLYHRLAALVEDGKPKGQRWATFNKLEDRLQRVSDAFDASLCWRLESLGFKPKN
ncbi:MAG: hypothetical protein V4731_03170 [Pseudomonadota bacterium]